MLLIDAFETHTKNYYPNVYTDRLFIRWYLVCFGKADKIFIISDSNDDTAIIRRVEKLWLRGFFGIETGLLFIRVWSRRENVCHSRWLSGYNN